MKRRESLLLREPPRWPLLGLAVAVLAVAVTTLVIYPIRTVAPAVSLGVVYLLAVLLISILWGLRLGLLTALASALAFNYFHIPPTGRFTISEGENWVALGVFFASALIAGYISELARSRAREAEERRREADLSADLARLLLGGRSLQAALDPAGRRIAEALDIDRVRLLIGEARPPAGWAALPLRHRDRIRATLLVPAGLPAGARERLEERVGPSLEALIAAAIDRESLMEEAVEAHALRRSDEVKTALLRAVSHDLRSPLTAIMTAGDALGSGGLSESERAELSRAVTDEAERLSELVENLLDLSRLEAGAAEPRRDWCSVEELVAAAVDEIGDEKVRVSVLPDCPLILADAAQLQRALANLIRNAVAYSRGQPVVVKAGRVGGRIVIRVVDRGPGIEPTELDHIFQPFYRGGGRRAHPGGAGLGLAIVKGFVEANGGTVRAETLPGQGTTFVVELPVPEGAPATAVAAPSQ